MQKFRCLVKSPGGAIVAQQDVDAETARDALPVALGLVRDGMGVVAVSVAEILDSPAEGKEIVGAP